MSVKNKLMAFLMTFASMSGGKAAAQEISTTEAKTDSTEVVAPIGQDTLTTSARDSVSIYDSIVFNKNDTLGMDVELLNAICPVEKSDLAAAKTVLLSSEGKAAGHQSFKQQMRWENTPEGKEIISEYVQALQKLGETPEIKDEDVVYIRALADLNREVAMIDGTGYVMSRDDFKGIVPDSLQNELAENAKNWLTPAKYAGRNCAHAVKGNMLIHGLMLSIQGIVPACDMEKPLMEDPNFIGFMVKPGESTYVTNGGTKIYRRTRAHPYGHIGIAINDSTAEFSKDSSDKLRNSINEDNYNGVVCFFTAHSQASFSTCIAAWATKYKEDHRPMVVDGKLPVSEFSMNVKPRQIFETAISCKEKYSEKYMAAIRGMPTNHVERDGYIYGPPVKLALLAKGARRAPVHRTTASHRGYARR